MNGHTPSILLVDDDEDICACMADILSEFGYHVDVAHEGATALDLVRRRSYDVALVDLMMPGMDGLALARAIKAVRSETATLLVTAHSDGCIAAEARAAGMEHVLSKPVDIPQLLKTVGRLAPSGR